MCCRVWLLHMLRKPRVAAKPSSVAAHMQVYGGPSGAPWPFREGVIKKVTQVYEGAPAQVTW